MVYLPIPPIEEGNHEVFLYFTNRKGLSWHMDFITKNPEGNFRATSVDKIVAKQYDKISDIPYYKDPEIKEAISKFVHSSQIGPVGDVYLIEAYIHKSNKIRR